ncbi:MAG TPA: elongation factor P [Candidatus Dojkabacteria bacterium]|jgi:elongation factor P|nr:elongation factor P [Candidatus Dojkabacteria bacterium]HOV17586.1 elongation factor P [Candidatus Dojkabacteria bacterium]HPM14055.1 elongation factor P [Candidatus Dojkabacteria bacterium]HQA87809.1 elongation factor P [Candidatus Dojkabacteria bacterium]HQJ73416.1 elongation factor P [Candidatus Dojkabacteria bacterium]
MPLTDQPVKGMYIKEDGRFFFLEDRKLKTQGRQGGLVIMKLKALDNGQIINKTVKSGTKVEYINPETKEAQYLYKDDSFAYFMDTSTYETVNISKDVIGSYVNFLKEGDSILMLTYEGKILSIKENPSVVLEVTVAQDAVKGNTANNATKLVTVETGYQLKVPLFIKKGDKIKINTETGEYSGKAN